MPPIKLTDAELDAVLAAARPLDVRVRDAFLQAVADALQGYSEIGPGLVGRVVSQIQKQYFDPPDLRGEDPPARRRVYPSKYG